MNLAKNLISGTVISVPKPPFIHFGILIFTPFREALVISNSFRRNQVIIETLAEFCSGRKFKVHNMWGGFSSTEVELRARQLIGSRYSPSKYNCEHFVRQVHGLPVESPQLNIALGVAILAGMTLMFSKAS